MISVNTPLFNGNEKKYLAECIDTGWVSSDGPFVAKFEQAFAHYCNRKYAVAVSSGSAALDCAVQALQLPRGSEIILPAFTIISCAASVIRAGYIPVLVDADAGTWNMNTELIEQKITPKTKAIMAVHIYGLPVDMDPIFALAKKYDLKIIEDAAEQIGQTYYSAKVGSLGDVSTFSFYPNKHITTGEGGMIVTDDLSIAERCRLIRNLCFVPQKRFYHEELGYNYRMSNLHAAIGLAQLEQIDSFLLKKREMGLCYHNHLQNIEELQLPLPKKEYAENIYWVFGIVLNNKVPFNAEKAMLFLQSKGIGTRPFFYPMHLQPVFQKKGLFVNEFYPVAEHLAERGLYLPSGLGLTKAEQDVVLKETVSLLQLTSL